VRENRRALFDLFMLLIFVEGWRIAIGYVGFMLAGIPYNGPVSEQTIYWFFLGTMILSFYLALKWFRARQKEHSFVDATHLSLQARAMKKIERWLSPEERIELEDILYQQEALGKVSVQLLAKILWLSLIFALVLEVAKELFRRA